MRGNPARNKEIATIVGMTAMPTLTAQALPVRGRSRRPSIPATRHSTIAVADIIVALAATAGTELIARSPRRMNAV